tara:strand:- start:1466 stop:1576 length:111 start_codon:yes stop_codon:yes gene_type:complete
MKKIAVLILLIFLVISCGKKADPEYKAKNNIMIVYN